MIIYVQILIFDLRTKFQKPNFISLPYNFKFILSINQLQPSVAYLYLLKTSENLKVFKKHTDYISYQTIKHLVC